MAAQQGAVPHRRRSRRAGGPRGQRSAGAANPRVGCRGCPGAQSVLQGLPPGGGGCAHHLLHGRLAQRYQLRRALVQLILELPAACTCTCEVQQKANVMRCSPTVKPAGVRDWLLA